MLPVVHGDDDPVEAANSRHAAILQFLPAGRPENWSDCRRVTLRSPKRREVILAARALSPRRTTGSFVSSRRSARSSRTRRSARGWLESAASETSTAARADLAPVAVFSDDKRSPGWFVHGERRATFDSLWRALEARHGPLRGRPPDGRCARARDLGAARVELAARGALSAGALEGGAVAVLARHNDRIAAEPLSHSDLPDRLAASARPEPDLRATTR